MFMNTPEINYERLVPTVPSKGKCIRAIIDTDAANEIDDLYAIALALVSPERFKIEGFNATHFSNQFGAGPVTIDMSYSVIMQLLESASLATQYNIFRGSDPFSYPKRPTRSSAVDFIIEQAYKSSKDDPLWVICLGAATNVASALLIDPEIRNRINCVFHARGEEYWPERTVQFNIQGDILAASYLLESGVPLVWFDTGTKLCASYEYTERYIATTGKLGEFIHNYRNKNEIFLGSTKGFFDLGDIAWLLEPKLCKTEIISAPGLTRYMYFDHLQKYGKMLRVHSIDPDPTWELLRSSLEKRLGG